MLMSSDYHFPKCKGHKFSVSVFCPAFLTSNFFQFQSISYWMNESGRAVVSCWLLMTPASCSYGELQAQCTGSINTGISFKCFQPSHWMLFLPSKTSAENLSIFETCCLYLRVCQLAVFFFAPVSTLLCPFNVIATYCPLLEEHENVSRSVLVSDTNSLLKMSLQVKVLYLKSWQKIWRTCWIIFGHLGAAEQTIWFIIICKEVVANMSAKICLPPHLVTSSSRSDTWPQMIYANNLSR